jgi:hypothetical protein
MVLTAIDVRFLRVERTCRLHCEMSASDPRRTLAAAVSKSRKFVKEKIDGGDLAAPGDYEIGSGVSRRLVKVARHPAEPPAIADHLRRGERLISEVRMSSLDHARDAVDLVATAVSAVGFVEYGVFVEDFVDCCAPTYGINLSEYIMQIAKQQGRYGVGHGFSRFGVEWRLIRANCHYSFLSLSHVTNDRLYCFSLGFYLQKILANRLYAVQIVKDGRAIVGHWLAILDFRKELPVIMAFLFTDRLLSRTDKCRVLCTEATIAAEYHLPTPSQGLNSAILFDSACPCIHIRAPGPLVWMTCAEHCVECTCRCRVGAKANWRENNQSCQKWDAQEYLPIISAGC